MIESQNSVVQAKGMSIMVYYLNKEWGELKHKKDVKPVIGFSFTAEGAKRAYKAALAAANQ